VKIRDWTEDENFLTVPTEGIPPSHHSEFGDENKSSFRNIVEYWTMGKVHKQHNLKDGLFI
jgi:hypothetical protein